MLEAAARLPRAALGVSRAPPRSGGSGRAARGAEVPLHRQTVTHIAGKHICPGSLCHLKAVQEVLNSLPSQDRAPILPPGHSPQPPANSPSAPAPGKDRCSPEGTIVHRIVLQSDFNSPAAASPQAGGLCASLGIHSPGCSLPSYRKHGRKQKEGGFGSDCGGSKKVR